MNLCGSVLFTKVVVKAFVCSRVVKISLTVFLCEQSCYVATINCHWFSLTFMTDLFTPLSESKWLRVILITQHISADAHICTNTLDVTEHTKIILLIKWWNRNVFCCYHIKQSLIWMFAYNAIRKKFYTSYAIIIHYIVWIQLDVKAASLFYLLFVAFNKHSDVTASDRQL